MTRIEFEHTLSATRGKLLAVAKSFTRGSGSSMDAEDIVQEALAEFWVLFEQGYAIRNAEALAVKITKTVCVRHYRRRKVQTTPIDGKDYPGGTEASGRIDLQESMRIREMLWKRLSETQKRYLDMRNEQGMSLDEIAAETGRPKASVKSTISQARKMMYEQLKKISE